MLERTEVEILPTRALLQPAASLIELDHRTDDWVHLAPAANDWKFMTAEEGLVRKLRQNRRGRLRTVVVPLLKAPEEIQPDSN
ncbi:MAG TPA: hypothetical protein VGH29_19745 [Candidatus Binataceae bacterium]